MTIEEKLKEIILSRYNSLRDFTIQADISYSTINSILTRGILNANVNSIMKICNELQISADALARGEILGLTKRPTTTYYDSEIKDIIETLKNQLIARTDLTLEGEIIDPNKLQIILTAIDIGVEIAKTL